MATEQELSGFIWQIADLLRGPYRPPQYERVMLPMTVLRRFDCVLEKTKDRVLKAAADIEEKNKTLKEDRRIEGDALDRLLNQAAGERFHNHSPLTFERLKADPENIARHLTDYIYGFSRRVQRIFEYFEFEKEIEKMREANILYLVVSKFADVDLHPDHVPNHKMGSIFEDLIRRFNELANETAGDHFTPRDVIQLMVDILFTYDDRFLSEPGTIRKILDPTCGTGGMLTFAQNYLTDHHEQAKLFVYGQDFNPRAYAIADADLLIKGNEKSRIEFGDSLVDDKFENETFDYFLANPPFGVDWKRQQSQILREHEKQGFEGRFGAGLPRVNDGALLFLQHMISKFEPVAPAEKKDGSRLALVFNGSPLFTGGAGSGESEIRRWIIEEDLLETVIALPEQMFYNTGIGTYIWILTNRKEKRRKNKIQLIDARSRWTSMRRSLGNKRREISPQSIYEIVHDDYGDFAETETSKIFDNEDFGYTRVTVERPLRLKFQITVERKTQFYNAYPQLLDDVEAIDEQLGRAEHFDWNSVWERISELLKKHGSKWRTAEVKLFRGTFTERAPEAARVVAKVEKMNKRITVGERFGGWFAATDADEQNALQKHLDSLANRKIIPTGKIRYEADSELREFENVPLKPVDDENEFNDFSDGATDYEKIPLKDNIERYFEREVLPHVPEAWMDRDKDKIGYEINFNRYFYKYNAPRPLAEIDADLKKAETKILELLNSITTNYARS